MQENSDLLAAIQTALDGHEVYATLRRYVRDLYREERFDEADDFNSIIDPKLGCEVIGTAVWNSLNPLLEQAAARMQQVGIDASQFYG